MKEISFKNDILPLGDKLYRLALRITCNKQEAEDVVQDTLIKLWEGREKLKEVDNLTVYAMTICRNQALDHNAKHENKNISLEDSGVDGFDNQHMPDERLIYNQRYEIINELINKMPEKQRTVIQLRDIEGRNYQEISLMMNISLADVKVTLFRARQQLKEQLKKQKNGL
ncbi:MAG: RNA polymerase sigma factor [Bacteroidaceae bacterium]|nr:RNA polymerase sigma factor [Bacteroidaceae bacterium]